MSEVSRLRWAAVGAAVAISLGVGGFGIARATISSGAKAVYVPITPCRLVDTRPGPSNVGTRATPIGAGQTHTVTVRGASGRCNIPAGASAVVANVTAVSPTAQSHLTIWPADKPRPVASSLNYSAGQAPVPNAVTVALSNDGRISLQNLAGSVDLVIDLAGYYEDHTHDDRYYTRGEIDALIAAAGAGGGATSGALVDVEVVEAVGTTTTASGVVIATCPSGKRVIGGGGGANNVTLRMYASVPNGTTGWFVTVIRDAAGPSATFRAYAICAAVTP